MDLSGYRREYADYCSALERERYMHHAGLKPELQLAPVRERYTDLWTREAIDDLRKKFDETPPHFETERDGLRALTRIAERKHAESGAAEVTSELGRCEAAARIVRGGESFGAEEAQGAIASEPDAARRRDLAARWFDAARTCDDLRAARLETLRDAALSLGLDNLHALYEDADGPRLTALASQARAFLERTSAVYMSHLARWAARETPAASPASLSYADALLFRRAAHLDALFPARGARAAYGAAMGGLGVRVEGQKNVLVDDEARPLKHPRARSFGVRPPEDVRLVTPSRAGAEGYTELFFEGGRAQHFAWSSPELAARYPEFIHAPDESARDGAGFLLSALFRDTAWVGEHLSLRADEARELTRSVALLELEDARRCCARLEYALALGDSTDLRSERLAETYVNLYREATGFAHDPATGLIDAADAFGAAGRLRARLFAASLREHLRERHGRRWHNSRAAGGELIDLWNAAARYAAEELARLAWGGHLDFELLAEDLKAALDGV